jgi:hypothetical protein
MRGHTQSAFKATINDNQTKFATMSRSRRSRIAKSASTTLVIAHVWARGSAVAPEIATALETATGNVKKK